MQGSTSSAVFEFRGYRLDPKQRRLTSPRGEPLTLRPKEFDTLLVLVERNGVLISKDELMATVWPGTVVEENNLNQVVSKLRQILGDDRSNPLFIATITGRGYQFVADVERLDTTPKAPGARHGRPNWSASLLALSLIAVAASVLVIAALTRLWDSGPAQGTAVLDDARLVTGSSYSSSMPTLSPDGTLMAFVSDRTGTLQIWVQGLANSNSQQLTDGPVPATSPSWSPISDTILFQRAAPDGMQAIWRVDALASTAPKLVVRNGTSPKFAPDGRNFVFTRNAYEIHVGDIDSGTTWQLEGLPETRGFAEPEPAINANGDIAFVHADEGPSGNVWVFDADTDSFRQLTRSQSEFAGVWARSPTWMPDDSTIVYAAAGDDLDNSHLWQIDKSGGEPLRLSTGVGGYGEPSVSRDGSKLVYSHAQPIWRLVRTDPETGERRTLYENREGIALPAISTDGESIVFFADNVYTVPIEGGDARRLTFGPPGDATLPSWSRSDDAIYYYKGRQLHRLDPATGASELVLDDFHWSKQNWLAVHGQRLAYRINSRWPGRSRSVIHALDTGEVIRLDKDIGATDWTRDGQALLGRYLKGAPLLICSAPDFDCKALQHEGEVIGGARPRWSHDETRVFFRRARPDKPGYAEIWVVAREGGEPRPVAEIGPYEPMNMFFAIASDDTIIWPEVDSRGSSEIWAAGRPPQ